MNRPKILAAAIAASLTVSISNVSAQGLFGLPLTGSGLLGGSSATASTSALISSGQSDQQRLVADLQAAASLLPNLSAQAQANAQAILNLYQFSVLSPLDLLAGHPVPIGSAADRLSQFFPTGKDFAEWLALLDESPTDALAELQNLNPAESAAVLADLLTVTRMLSERVPQDQAEDLPLVAEHLGGLLGGGLDGLGPVSTLPADLPAGGGQLGAILAGLFGQGQPAQPSPGGAGYGPSLLPVLSVGSSPTGTGHAFAIDYIPPVNLNAITSGIREVVTRKLPVLPTLLPNSVLGLITFRTFHTTDRTGSGSDQYDVPANHPAWTGAAIDIGVPGIGRLWTVEMTCPGLNRHSVAPVSPYAVNPNYDPQAAANYTGWYNTDLTHRKTTLSWGFGDGLIDDVWIYGHYAAFTAFGNGDTGPGVTYP
ncbi:hypothetical protein [Methylomicrobium lacus]|uniref:hypothetical protein n=1 Tax=Methylomicrobium lacus TaxID=136992 RepID=UPI0035A96AD4